MREYEITSCEYVYCRGEWESVEDSGRAWEFFDSREEALAAFNSSCYEPEFDGDGYDLRVYELQEIRYDDDGEICDVDNIDYRWPSDAQEAEWIDRRIEWNMRVHGYPFPNEKNA